MRSPIQLCLPLLSMLVLPAFAWADFPPIDPPPAQPPTAAPDSVPVTAPVVAPPSAPSVAPNSAPVTAPAPDASAARMHLELSVLGRYAPSIDLADFAGVSNHGTANDAGTGTLGFQLSVGVQYDPLEFGVDITRALGGLDAKKIDARYFDGSDPAARALTDSAGLRIWWVHAARPDFDLVAGPHARWLFYSSESGVSRTQLNVFGMGAQFGFRWRTNRISELIDGSIRVLASAHGNLPTLVTVRQASGDVLFRESSPDGVFFDFGLTIGYGVAFR